MKSVVVYWHDPSHDGQTEWRVDAAEVVGSFLHLTHSDGDHSYVPVHRIRYVDVEDVEDEA